MFELKPYIREIQDFPKKGINYKDITPLLSDILALKKCADIIAKIYEHEGITKVIGIESRGFFLGTLIAERLQAGFVPVRKPGKLPYATYKEAYALEYGEDALEIHIDAIAPNEKILIHDDVLATGGTALAAIRLAEKLQANIIGLNFLIELEFLGGRNRLIPYSVDSLCTY